MNLKESIKDRILSAVDPKEFYSKEFPDWGGDNKELLHCPRGKTHHEGGDDSSASFSVNGDTGEFNCYGCGFHGTSIIGYYTDIHAAGNFKKALAVLYRRYVGTVISQQDIKQYHQNLLKRPGVIRALLSRRRWNQHTIEQFRLGWDSDTKRVTIPVYTAAGFAVDIRKHDSLYKADHVGGKRIPLLAGGKGTSGMFYPLRPDINPFSTKETEVWIVEGEPDVLSARQEGLNAVTVTGGAQQLLKLSDSLLRVLHKKNIILCLDNDKTGQSVAKELAARLVAVEPLSLKNIVVPEGKDITEFFVRHGGSGDVMRQVAEIERYLIKPQGKNAHVLALSETSQAKYIAQPVVTEVLINGKHKAPHIVPRKITFSCHGGSDSPCDNCPGSSQLGVMEHYIHSDDKNLLKWINQEPKKMIKSEYNLKPRCNIEANVDEWQNLEQLSIIPALSTSSRDNKQAYCQRTGFFVGHGIEPNENYRIQAIPTMLPRTSESALIITDVSSNHDTLETFALSADDVQRLKKLFFGHPKDILKEIAESLAFNVTKIYDREDLHIAVDLAFHGPCSFNFGGSSLPKGSIELLLFGDTRCGKGQVAEGISRYYDLGTTVSGESASFMGLLGGAAKVGDNFQLVWGAIPINNRRLVIIDEFSGLSNNELGRLSRLRSEGIAELNKGGINAKTQANARMIWIANPRKGKPVSAFASGAQSIMDLIGAAEDVARFDLAVVVQKDEVDPTLINRHHRTIESRFSQSDLRSVLLWVWSRRREHIIFTREASNYILRASSALATRYSSTVPLVQGENIRFKLAKLSAAVAGRVFSTEDGKFLKVEEVHAKTAVAFLCQCYDKPSMGYRQFSELQSQGGVLDHATITDWMGQYEEDQQRVIVDGMLESDVVSVGDFEDWTDHDTNRCRKQVGILVRAHALRKTGRGIYTLRPEFIRFLKKLRKKL